MGVAEVWQKPSTSACYCYVTKVGQVVGHVEPTTDNVTFHMEETDSKTIMDLGMDGWDTKPPPSQNNTVFSFSPMRTQGMLEMATPKENMKRKMKTTIAHEINLSSTSKCACLEKDGSSCIFSRRKKKFHLRVSRPPMRAIARVETAQAGI